MSGNGAGTEEPEQQPEQEGVELANPSWLTPNLPPSGASLAYPSPPTREDKPEED